MENRKKLGFNSLTDRIQRKKNMNNRIVVHNPIVTFQGFSLFLLFAPESCWHPRSSHIAPSPPEHHVGQIVATVAVSLPFAASQPLSFSFGLPRHCIQWHHEVGTPVSTPWGVGTQMRQHFGVLYSPERTWWDKFQSPVPRSASHIGGECTQASAAPKSLYYTCLTSARHLPALHGMET